MKTTIENKTYSEQEARRLLLKALQGHDGKLTKADAVALSGLPEATTEGALEGLLKEFKSHLAATESGELIYQFDPAFKRRDAVPLRERLAKVGRALWKGFTFAFKVSIVTTLACYFAVFVAMLLAVVFARRSDDRDSGDDVDFGWPLFWMWGWGDQGNAYGRRRSRPRSTKPLYKRVFEFVFGPPQPKADPLAQEKEILSYIRAQRGRIAAVDLVRLMGWDFSRAEEEATRLLVSYGGEPEVTEDGVVVYAFKNLRKTAGEADGALSAGGIRRAWERMETRPPQSGNSVATDVAISLFNGFNLLAPFWIVPAFEERLGVSLANYQFLLRDFPLAFSSLFFAVPLGRWLVERVRDRGRAKRNASKRLLRSIMERRGMAAPAEDIASDPVLAKALSDNLVLLGGDVTTDESGRVRYVFPRISEELGAVERERSHASPDEANPGQVVFSSTD